MTAVIWKEVCENLKWAVLWLLGLTAAIAYVLSSQSTDWYRGVESLCASNFLLVMTFGSAIGGVLLGLLQTVSETRRDQWAFLIHRPLTRTKLFLGKVLGGLVLYLAAVGLPLLGAAIWASTPGHIAAPFDWRMALPGLADILAGIAFYFAGLLTGLRPARWYGSRALGVAASVPCAFLVASVPEFWQAALIVAGFVLALGIAAWSSFLAGGAYGPQPRLGRIALGLSLVVGIFVVGGFLAGMTLEVVSRPSFSPGSWTRYAITKGGQIIQITEGFGGVVQVNDLEGNEITKYRNAGSDLYRNTLSPQPIVQYVARSGYQNASRYFLPLYSSGDTAWYFVNGERRLQAYSRTDDRFIGWLTPAGFTPANERPASAFPDPALQPPRVDVGMLVLTHEIYKLDLPGRQAARVFWATAGQEIVNSVTLHEETDTAQTTAQVVATRDQILILTADFHPLAAISYQYDLKKYPLVQISMTRDGERYFIEYSLANPSREATAEDKSDHIVEINAQGDEVKRYDLSASFPVFRSPGWTSAVWASVMPLIVVIVGTALMAAFSPGGIHLRDLAGFFAGPSADFGQPPTVYIVILLVSALVCAGVCWWLARRYALARRTRIGWSFVGLFLGPAGVLMFIGLRDWPARERCDACGRKRVVDRDVCEHCGAPFAPAAMDGTEIFEA